MFEKLCLTPRTNTSWGSQIDPGFLAESLIFYGTVYIAANRGVIEQLIQICGPEALVELVEQGNLRVLYEHEMCAVQTTNSGSLNERHSLALISLVDGDAQNEIPKIFIKLIGKEGRGRRLARRFVAATETIPHLAEFIPSARQDLRDQKYVNEGVKRFMAQYVPEYPQEKQMDFVAEEEGEWFRVQTNIDFSLANRHYHSRVSPSHSSLTPAYLLSHIVNARHTILLSSQYQTELALDVLQSSLVSSRMEELIRRSQKSESAMRTFEELVLENGRDNCRNN